MRPRLDGYRVDRGNGPRGTLDRAVAARRLRLARLIVRGDSGAPYRSRAWTWITSAEGLTGSTVAYRWAESRGI